ncbi:hypothetical protein [Novosphingobium sp. PhB165]|nr:hypothetical protein [Novosphingobium sp. PhB165]
MTELHRGSTNLDSLDTANWTCAGQDGSMRRMRKNGRYPDVVG